MLEKTHPSPFRKWVAIRGGHYKDGAGTEVRFEAGDEYKGPNPEAQFADGVIAPAQSGYRQPGTNEGTEA